MRKRSCAADGLALAILVACLAPAFSASAQTRFVAEGRVLAADLRAGTVTFVHDAIPGLGPADTTDLRAQRPEILDGLRVGDTVRLTLEAAEGTHGLLTVVGIEPILAGVQTTRVGAGTEPGATGRAGDRVPVWALAGEWVSHPGPWLLPVLAAIMAAIALGALIPGYLAWRLGRRHGATLTELEQAHDSLRADLETVSQAVQGIGDTFRDRQLRDIRRRLDAVQAVRGHGQKPGGSNGSGHGAPEPAPSHLVVLRRDGPMPGAVTDLVRALQARLGRSGLLRVIRDRRQGDRRRAREEVGQDRRRTDRRAAPPETWSSLGLVLASGEEGAHPPSRTPGTSGTPGTPATNSGSGSPPAAPDPPERAPRPSAGRPADKANASAADSS